MSATYDSMAVMVRLFWPSLAFVAVTLVALALRGVALSLLRRLAARAYGVSAFAEGIRVASLLWCLVLGLYAAIEIASEFQQLPRRLSEQLSLVLQGAIIVSVTITVANVLSTAIRHAAETRALAVAVTGLAQTAVRGLVLIVGALVLLSSLGIQITPILTALGVGGLAVALALQDSLSNLFAGMHILADRPIRVGDYVKIAGEVEGFVVDLGWRSTRVRMLANNVVVVPNKKVAESIIVNYDMPESRMSLLVQVGVGYQSDPDHVERVLVEEALAAAGEVPGLLADPAPFVRFIPGFGAYSLDFTLICQVSTFVDQYLAQHELRKRILRRFRSEGIEIPFPTQVHVEAASRQASALSDSAQERDRADHRQG